MEAGAYGKDTIVEDFDQTIKLLKAGLITQGSSKQQHILKHQIHYVILLHKESGGIVEICKY